jgi:hypothetical protein
MDKKKPFSNKELLFRYVGLATQLLICIGVALFAGYKADEWLKLSPLFTVLLPLLVLIFLFYKLIRETAGRQ